MGVTMDFIIEPERRTPVVADIDVLVCGGGFAGVCSAVGAARNGAKVLLLERYGFLGGLCTAGLVITTPPLDNGLNFEIAGRLRKEGAYVPCFNSGEQVAGLNLHAIDPEILKYQFIQMLQEAGVSFWFHTYIVDVIMEDRTIKGVVIQNKAGRQAVRSKVVVDATGDGDVAALAGAPFELLKKPMTMMFNMAGVDIPKVLEKFVNWGGIREALEEGIARGEISFHLGLNPEFGSPGVYAEELVHDGELNIWAGNLLDMNGLDPEDLTHAEVITRDHAMKLANFLRRKVHGFEKARIECTATQVGVRATRKIIGEASPTLEGINHKTGKDVAAKPYATWPMRLPYGCLLPRNVENLLMAGRCISAEEEAMGQLRLLPVCSSTGQAAGTAGALAIHQGILPRYLNLSSLQKTLMKQGMDLGISS